MKITLKTTMTMRSAASAVLVAGAMTGACHGMEPSAALGDSPAFNSMSRGAALPSKGDEKSKEPEKKEEKEDPCYACGRG